MLFTCIEINVYVCAHAHVCKAEDNLLVLVFSFSHVGPRDDLLVGRGLYLLSRLTTSLHNTYGCTDFWMCEFLMLEVMTFHGVTDLVICGGLNRNGPS